MERVVLAYGGGFDPAAAVRSLVAAGAGEIVAVTMDLGQGVRLEELRDRALAAGAARAHVLDLREAFAAGYVLPSLKADATGDDGAPMAAALGKALIAEKLVDVARIEQAGAVAHGPGAPHEDPSMFNRLISTRAPDVRILPLPCTPPSRADFARPVSTNLWGRTVDRAGSRAQPEDSPESAYTLTKPPAACPAEPASVEIRFERGVPVGVNGVPMPLVELIASLTYLAGAHGVGRISTPCTILETPAASVLHEAHRELQGRTAGKDADRLGRQYADIIANGLWSTPPRAALDKAIEKLQKRVNGSVRLKLLRGTCTLMEPRVSPASV